MTMRISVYSQNRGRILLALQGEMDPPGYLKGLILGTSGVGNGLGIVYWGYKK